MKYIYNRETIASKLQKEILASSITIAINYISVNDSKTVIDFKVKLVANEEAILNNIVDNHTLDSTNVNISVVDFVIKDSSGYPIIHSTPRPSGHSTYFTGSGDSEEQIGAGNKLLFSLSEVDKEQSVDIKFNGDVYIKDGFIMTTNAPLGSYMDIEVIHPVHGVVGRFCNQVYLLEQGRIPIDSEDCALIVNGLSLRCTIHNSSGTGIEDQPKAFKVVARIEMYRRKTV